MRVSATAMRSTTGVTSSTCRILAHRVPHTTDGINLVFERLPVVPLVDRRPDRLDVIDVHRAELRIRPIRVRLRPLASFERLGECAVGIGGIKLRARVATTPPIQENAVDGFSART